MATGNIPSPVVSTTPTLLTGRLLGSVSNNQRDLVVQALNTWLAGGWTVVQSYDASGVLPAAGVNAWTDYTKLLGASGGGGIGASWIVLGNPWNTSQVCLYCLVSSSTTGWSEFQIIGAAAGGFTGGTTVARPTAPNEMIDQVLPSSFLGTGPVGNPQFYAVTWVADDGTFMRTGWFYGGKLKSFWSFEQLKNGPSGWTTPLLIENFHFGNTDYTVTGLRALGTQFALTWGSGGVWKQILTPTGTPTLEQTWGSLEYAVGAGFVTDQANGVNGFSNQYLWIAPMGHLTAVGVAPHNGFWGYSRDQWWTSTFNDGDTMGDNYNFIILGQMVLQWGLGDVAGRLGGASTNYPTARFFGRDGAGSICSCGPDTCNTPTTPLITLRNGAKELADKVNDLSVTDITWNVWINQGVESLWSLVATAFSDQFFKTVDFTLTGGVGGNIYDVTTIPAADFRRIRMLEWMPDTNSRRKVRAFNWNEKDQRGGSYANTLWCNLRRYRLMGQKLYVEPYETAAGTYRLYYVPGPAKLTLTCDAIDPSVNEWAEYPMIFAAMKALGKEESDDSTLGRRLIDLKAEILDAAASRNDGDADVVADVEGGSGYFG